MNTCRVLVVDDSRAMRRILRRIVEPLDLHIAEAADAIEALHCLEAHPEIELILFEGRMSGIPVSEFVQTVKALPRPHAIKLVLITTDTEPSGMARALISGIDAVLVKPFTPAMFLNQLQLIGVSLPVNL